MYVGALPYCNNVPPLDWTATPRRLGCGYASTSRQRGTRTRAQPRAGMRQLTVTGQYDLSVRCTVYDLSEHLGGYLGTFVRSLRASRRTPRPWSDRTGAYRATCSSAPDNIGTPPPPIVSHACASEYLRGVPTPTHGYARCHSTSRTCIRSH